MENVWQEVLDKVRPQVRPVEFRNWLKPVQAVEWQNGTVTLLVKDGEFQTWFVEHYEPLVLRALEAVTQKPLEVEYKFKNPELFDHAITASAGQQPRFESDYTFDGFVVGSSNHMAYAAAKAVAGRPGRNYNPLFIYGGTGLGKTHLLCAIGHAAQQRNPRLRVVYITLDTYLNDFYSSVRLKRMDQFRVKYRDSCDLLLVDDVHFLSGRGERTQFEFFHAFNALHSAHKQIVLTSDRFPREIPDIEDRLLSRFEWGLIADISAPEMDTRMAILQHKAVQVGLELPGEVADLIAREVSDNVRELESCLNRLQLESLTKKVPITIKLARESLKSYFKQQARKINVENIMRVVSQRFSVALEDLTSKSRKKSFTTPRHISMYLIRKFTQLSLPEIGRRFGGRDHTSVMAGIRKIQRNLKVDTTLQQAIEELEQRLKR